MTLLSPMDSKAIFFRLLGPAMDHLEVWMRLKDGSTSTAPFPGEQLTVGRSRQHCDVTIEDPFLSRQHLTLLKERGSVFVVDTSRNGTLVNGVRIRPHVPRQLRAGDIIEASGHELSLRSDRDIAPSETIWKDASEIDDLSSVTGIGEIADQATLSQYAKRLGLVNEIHEALGVHVTEAELLDLVLERACELLGTESGDIFLHRSTGGYERAASRCPSGAQEIPYSRSLMEGVCLGGKTAVVPDTFDASAAADSESILGSGIRSLVAAPLPAEGQALGMVVLGSGMPARFDEEDVKVLATLASIAGMKIRHARLLEEAAKKNQELALARRVQQSLLQPALPEVPGFDLDAENLPSLEVSGDYYRVIQRQETREWALLVVDVSGKGMPAALLTASVDALMEGPIEIGLDPAAVCERVSRRLFRRTEANRYATAFLAILDETTGGVRFTNAGHVPGLIVRRSGEVEELGSTGPPLGLLERCTFSSEETVLEAGDLLLILTDGLTEAESPAGEEFGLERLKRLLSASPVDALEELAERIGATVEEFTAGAGPSDDRTTLIVRRIEPASNVG